MDSVFGKLHISEEERGRKMKTLFDLAEYCLLACFECDGEKPKLPESIFLPDNAKVIAVSPGPGMVVVVVVMVVAAAVRDVRSNN